MLKSKDHQQIQASSGVLDLTFALRIPGYVDGIRQMVSDQRAAIAAQQIRSQNSSASA
jgi:hypothetical protein